MKKHAVDVDEVLKKLASKSMQQGAAVRSAVRDLTLEALQQRELTLKHVRKVLHSVTAGATQGVEKRELKVEKALSDTVAGMDDALLEAVEASRVALARMTGNGYDYDDSHLKHALGELERMEDEFYRSIVSATETASEKIRAPWDRVLARSRQTGTATGTQVAATVRDYARRAQTAMRAKRETGVRAAHLFAESFAVLASGILIGMSEGLGGRHAASRGKAKAPSARRPAATTARRAPASTGRAAAATGGRTAKVAKRAVKAPARTARVPNGRG